jgi:hypothetical protein
MFIYRNDVRNFISILVCINSEHKGTNLFEKMTKAHSPTASYRGRTSLDFSQLNFYGLCLSRDLFLFGYRRLLSRPEMNVWHNSQLDSGHPYPRSRREVSTHRGERSKDTRVRTSRTSGERRCRKLQRQTSLPVCDKRAQVSPVSNPAHITCYFRAST